MRHAVPRLCTPALSVVWGKPAGCLLVQRPWFPTPDEIDSLTRPPRFDAERTLQILERERITTWMAIPTLLQPLIENPNVDKYDLSSLTLISTGGAPMPPNVAERAQVTALAPVIQAKRMGRSMVHDRLVYACAQRVRA